MSLYTIADLQAGGVFVRHLSCGKDQLRQNVRDHEFAIEGHHDLYSKRFDEETQQVVDYVPPQPDADHEWNASTRRWQKRSDAIERDHRRALALARIRELELRQLRPMRELAADPHDDRAQGILAEIDGEIAQLRAQLQ
jgi:hypothetical protein